ncbi:MAG: hypothetical protein ACLFVR_14710 [Thiohalospira sp.]
MEHKDIHKIIQFYKEEIYKPNISTPIRELEDWEIEYLSKHPLYARWKVKNAWRKVKWEIKRKIFTWAVKIRFKGLFK